MTKAEFITAIAETAGTTKKDAGIVLDAITTAIIAELADGGTIKLQGLGTFSVVETAERNGRNPLTGDALVIPAGKKVKFKASKTLKEELNA